MLNDDRVLDSIGKLEAFELMDPIFLTEFVNYYDFDFKLELFEYYKVTTHSKLVDILNSEGLPSNSDIKYVNMEREVFNERYSSILPKIHSLGFYVYKFDSIANEITLASTLENYTAFGNRVDVHIPDLKVKKVLLTPLNYKRLHQPEKVNSCKVPSILFYRIIADALMRKASDVHFNAIKTANGDFYETTYRIGNDVEVVNLFDLDRDTNSTMIANIINTNSFDSNSGLKSHKGVLMSIHNPFRNGRCNLRVQCNSTIVGSAVSVRMFGDVRITSSIENLGFQPEVNDILYRMSRSSNGLGFVTGPVRSGKTTTLMGVFSELIKRKIKVAEISSPVESPMSINAFEYKNIEGLVDLISATKKMDLDVALLNEVPNKLVAEGVYDLVNSSIGVFTTFHINRIWHFFYKLREYFGEDYVNVTTHLRFIVNQKSFVQQCPHCLETKYISEKEDNLFPEVLELCKKFNILSYKQSKGCTECDHKKVLPGIRPYAEYLVVDDDLKSKIAQLPTLFDIEQFIRDKVQKDNTSLEYFVCNDIKRGILHPNDLINLL